MKRISLILLFLFIFSLYSTASTQAQTVEELSPERIISVEVIPEIPSSNQDVSIGITSFSYDLNRAKISWYLNDKLSDSGVGKTNFNFRTGNPGTPSNIVYKIVTSNGISFEKKISISPGDVSLFWESLAYTPPFYKGKTLFSFEGNARIIAIPNLVNSNGVKFKAEDLVYTWKRGMGTDTGASGYGKNVFFWNGDVVSTPETISVEVSDLRGTTKALASIVIEPKETEILAYENNPSLGILFNKAIKNDFNLKSTEVSFVAMPYYFNNPGKESAYSWFVNGEKSPETSPFITLRNTTNAEGYSKIGFDLTSQVKIMQSANSEFQVNLIKEGKSNNIFKNFFGE